ncbi:MAG: sugar ABC transporter permease [Thermobacillus sp.]|jgi:ribose/xylose/arabinose/galactoside ABC-type transport system permease subunit|uniref:Inner-membrane translocator n=1 Tax=Thermobacillus xylanilyticus TaxID=76633 RepID=A0ABN7RI97_THEXY|nr:MULTISPECIES: ABC transporter permease [Thermobacillus]REK58824.1 MAG: sugar ABC transporter permease [Thermobacillus sp.]CAG5076208.1 Inner-membrane translocator [Thermobacillus xylanilyticus]
MSVRWWNKPLFWPLAVFGLLLLLNLIFKPEFFAIRYQNGHLYGSLIDILNFGSPLAIVAIGMTLVIATRGIDLSVGSLVAISGAMACLTISRGDDQHALSLVLTAVLLALLVSIALGLWNGLLVAGAGIQPIIATLILMVAGRGIAQLITSGQIITVTSKPYNFIGAGWLMTLPFSVYLAAAVFLFAAWMTRKTSLGMFIEAIGCNPTASRLAGIRSRSILLAVYMFCALCAGIAGLITSSNVSSADGNNAGLWIELDAILAVVIGGTSLSGGRFSLTGTLAGALLIQTLTTTIYMLGVPPEITLVVKAFVVLAVCLIQSPSFRRSLTRGIPWSPAASGQEVSRHG